MQAAFTLPCDCSAATRCIRPAERKRSTVLSRVTLFALWALALALMLHGMRWTLQQSSAGSEFAAASYVFNDMYDGARARSSSAPGPTKSRGMHHD